MLVSGFPVPGLLVQSSVVRVLRWLRPGVFGNRCSLLLRSGGRRRVGCPACLHVVVWIVQVGKLSSFLLIHSTGGRLLVFVVCSQSVPSIALWILCRAVRAGRCRVLGWLLLFVDRVIQNHCLSALALQIRSR